jgi:Domain of unknown function (DUF1996)
MSHKPVLLVALAGAATLLLGSCAVSSPGNPASAGIGGTSYAPPAGGPWIDNTRLPAPAVGASTPLIRPADAVGPSSDGTGDFRIICTFSHMAYDDPIVRPGQRGASHLHTFFGNTALNANTTADNITTAGNSTCGGGTLNRSGYWVPSIIDTATGAPIVPDSLNAYYKSGYGGVIPSQITTPPAGLRMIAGVANAMAPVGAAAWDRKVSWNCQDGSASGTELLPGIPQCAPGQLLRMEVKFPQCWDGMNLDSPDHQSHMAYTVQGGCPTSHPVAIPEITFLVFWATPPSGTSTWRLSSDMYAGGVGGYSGHGDWFNGWDEATMQAWVQNCVHAGVDCHVGNLGDGRILWNS